MRLDPTLEYLGTLLPLAISVLVAIVPSPLTRTSRWTIVAIGFLTAAVILWQQTRARHQQQDVQAQARQLALPGIIATQDDVTALRQEMKSGMADILSAVKGMKEAPMKAETPQPPAIVQHLRFTEKRIASTSDEAPYALQVVIQTDVATQPTSLKVEFEGNIQKATFFEAGQAVYISRHETLQGNSFAFGFAFPPFTPESPIVVTVLSKSPVRVTRISRP